MDLAWQGREDRRANVCSLTSQMRSSVSPSNSGVIDRSVTSACISASVGRIEDSGPLATSRIDRRRPASLDELRKTPGRDSTQRTALAKRRLFPDGFVPAVVGDAVVGPAPAGHRLDGLHGDPPLGALLHEQLGVASGTRRSARD